MPARRRRARPRDRWTSSTAPSPRPASPWSSPPTPWPTTTTSTEASSTSCRCGPRVALGATRIFAVIAVPLTLPRDERDYAPCAGDLHRAAFHGHDRRGRATALEPDVQPPPGGHLDDGRPRRRRRRALRGGARAPCASTGTTAGSERPTSWPKVIRTSWRTWPRPPTQLIEARREAWQLEESLWAADPNDHERRRAPCPGAGAEDRGYAEIVHRRKQLGFPLPRRPRSVVERVRGAHHDATPLPTALAGHPGRLTRAAASELPDRVAT